MRYDSIMESVKNETIDEIIALKHELGHDYSDEELKALREKYSKMSLETLLAIKDELEDEFAFIMNFITDSEEETKNSEGKDCNCPEQKDSKQEEKKSEPEPVAEAKPVENPVNFVNKANEFEVDYFTYIKRILRIGGDTK